MFDGEDFFDFFEDAVGGGFDAEGEGVAAGFFHGGDEFCVESVEADAVGAVPADFDFFFDEAVAEFHDVVAVEDEVFVYDVDGSDAVFAFEYFDFFDDVVDAAFADFAAGDEVGAAEGAEVGAAAGEYHGGGGVAVGHEGVAPFVFVGFHHVPVGEGQGVEVVVEDFFVAFDGTVFFDPSEAGYAFEVVVAGFHHFEEGKPAGLGFACECEIEAGELFVEAFGTFCAGMGAADDGGDVGGDSFYAVEHF